MLAEDRVKAHSSLQWVLMPKPACQQGKTTGQAEAAAVGTTSRKAKDPERSQTQREGGAAGCAPCPPFLDSSFRVHIQLWL